MNYIHETAIIGDDVILGDNNYIGPNCYITGKTKIGDNNHFEAFCSIGTPAEHRECFKQKTTDLYMTIIGDNNVIREYVTINAGWKTPTTLLNNIVMLRGSYIGHDSFICDNVNLSCNVLIGGHCYLMEGCNFGLGSICHQYSKIGAYSMIGMGSIITKSSEIIPGNVWVGSPVKWLKENKIGLERNNIDSDTLNKFIKEFYEI